VLYDDRIEQEAPMNLQAVLEDFKKAQTNISQGIAYLENVLGSRTHVGTIRNLRNVNRTTAVPGKRRTLTAAAKNKIRIAMRARWAAKKAAAAAGKKLTVVGRKRAA
jgi:hypothetical protein